MAQTGPDLDELKTPEQCVADCPYKPPRPQFPKLYHAAPARLKYAKQVSISELSTATAFVSRQIADGATLDAEERPEVLDAFCRRYGW